MGFVVVLQCQKERDKEVSDDEAEAETEEKKEDEEGDVCTYIIHIITVVYQFLEIPYGFKILLHQILSKLMGQI